MIGIFWLISVVGEARLLAHTLLLDEAETYGDCLTCPLSHIDAWEATKRGAQILKPLNPASRAIIATSEYEEWPRGRIVYEVGSKRFVVYADRQAFNFTAQIRESLNLPEHTIFRTDLHYRNTKPLTLKNYSPVIARK